MLEAAGKRRARVLALCHLLACALWLRAVTSLAENALRDVSGTGWRLVEIMSMDDTVTKPEAGARYRLIFGVDGSVSVEAGCNRASSMLSVFDPPRLQFGDLSATRTACGPHSLSERFLAELGWVRSYIYRDGQLYLATKADGSIIEFAPLPADEATATVGSLRLVTEDVDAMRSIILTRLLDEYAVAHGITVSGAEADTYLAQMDQRMREELGDDYSDRASLTAGERAESDRMRRTMAEAVIRNWRINGALYRQYGGRIIYQQMGPEPLDAYLALLQEAHEAGRFRIIAGKLQEPFWAFFREDQRHSFMPPGSDDETRAFLTPPWAPAD